MKIVSLPYLMPIALIGIMSTGLVNAQTSAAAASAPAAHSASAPHGKHHDIPAMFKKLDVDKDEKISRTEAKGDAYLEKHFDEIDTNKDGFLSMDEVKAYYAKHKGK
jgi:hypothetical protein